LRPSTEVAENACHTDGLGFHAHGSLV